MNAKETATIRQALRLIATGETLDARRMLAQLTLASKPAAKAKKSERYRTSHTSACNCWLCLTYRDDFSRALWFDAMVLYPLTKPNIANLARVALESKESIAARLEVCACGHRSDEHTADELENLLNCSYVGCDCDHFHYQTDSESMSAAAGA